MDPGESSCTRSASLRARSRTPSRRSSRRPPRSRPTSDTERVRRVGLTSFATTRKSVDELPADAAAVFMFSGQKTPAGITNQKLRADLAGLIAEEKFEGKQGQAVVWYSNGQYPSRRFIVIGLGK